MIIELEFQKLTEKIKDAHPNDLMKLLDQSIEIVKKYIEDNKNNHISKRVADLEFCKFSRKWNIEIRKKTELFRSDLANKELLIKYNKLYIYWIAIRRYHTNVIMGLNKHSEEQTLEIIEDLRKHYYI